MKSIVTNFEFTLFCTDFQILIFSLHYISSDVFFELCYYECCHPCYLFFSLSHRAPSQVLQQIQHLIGLNKEKWKRFFCALKLSSKSQLIILNVCVFQKTLEKYKKNYHIQKIYQSVIALYLNRFPRIVKWKIIESFLFLCFYFTLRKNFL